MRIINRMANIICIIVIATMVVLLLFNWNFLPDTVPTHFTFNGTPDGFGGKAALINEPVIAVILFVLISVVQHFPKIWNFPVQLTEENMEREYLIIGTMLSVTKVLMVILFLLTELSALIVGFPAWPVMGIIVLMLLVVVGGIVLSIKCR